MSKEQVAYLAAQFGKTVVEVYKNVQEKQKRLAAERTDDAGDRLLIEGDCSVDESGVPDYPADTSDEEVEGESEDDEFEWGPGLVPGR
jgi:hypothetical protein